MTGRHIYVARINRVLDHISSHLGDPLDLQTLATVAHFSPWHFHRVFQGMTGETLADCVRRLRLEAAANRLIASPSLPALRIATDKGFGSAEVFSRAFRAHFGVTPTAWRQGAWREWAARNRVELGKIHQANSKQGQDVALLFRNDALHGWPAGPASKDEGRATMKVTLKTLPAMQLAYMRHTGPYGSPAIGQTWQRFCEWAGPQGLLTGGPMLGISQDNPEITPPAKCRYDCCVEAPPGYKPRGEVGVQAFSGGRYACATYTGTGADIHAAWMQLCGEWLPQSGYQADDKPALELYEGDFVVDHTTGAFRCLLCVPIRPL